MRPIPWCRAPAAPAEDITESASIASAFKTISESLLDASATDEQHARSGESDLLLIVASDLAGNVTSPMVAGQAKDLAFHIAALVKAARRVPGDTESPELAALIAAAGALLAKLTGDKDCLRRDEPAPHTSATKSVQLSIAQYRQVLETIAGHMQTLSQLVMLSNDPTQEDFVRDACGSAADALALQVGAMADVPTGGQVIGDFAHWSYGPNFKGLGKEASHG